jgi:hypothetical protein
VSALRALAVLWVVTLLSVPQEPAAAHRLLFIGNSLTTANNLPKLVEQIAAATGTPMASTVIAENNFSLGDHWERGDALKAIRRGGWAFVILQQGPSSLPDSRSQLIADTRRFDVEIRKAGARTALYMVWPSKDRLAFFADVSRSYSDAAKAVGGVLLPAGDAWRESWKAEPSMALYGPDDFHPSPLGSTVAANAIVRGLLAAIRGK